MSQLGYTWYPQDWWTSETFKRLKRYPMVRYAIRELFDLMYKEGQPILMNRDYLFDDFNIVLSDDEYKKLMDFIVVTEDGKWWIESIRKRIDKAESARKNGKKGGAPKGNNNAKKTTQQPNETTQENNPEKQLKKQPKNNQNNLNNNPNNPSKTTEEINYKNIKTLESIENIEEINKKDVKKTTQTTQKTTEENNPNNPPYKEKEKYKEKEGETRAMLFLKNNFPIRYETDFLMKYKSRINNLEKFTEDFDDKCDIEGLEFTQKILFARLGQFARNWIEFQNKNKPIENQNETCGIPII